MTARAPLSDSIKAPEIKRRCKALSDAMEANGGSVGAIRMLPDGTIEVVDKAVIATNDNDLGEWA